MHDKFINVSVPRSRDIAAQVGISLPSHAHELKKNTRGM